MSLIDVNSAECRMQNENNNAPIFTKRDTLIGLTTTTSILVLVVVVLVTNGILQIEHINSSDDSASLREREHRLATADPTTATTITNVSPQQISASPTLPGSYISCSSLQFVPFGTSFLLRSATKHLGE